MHKPIDDLQDEGSREELCGRKHSNGGSVDGPTQKSAVVFGYVWVQVAGRQLCLWIRTYFTGGSGGLHSKDNFVQNA